MARSFAASTGGCSRQGAGAGARDPWEDAAAALQSRLSRTPSEPWGTGTRAWTEAPATDSWGTGASMEVPVTNISDRERVQKTSPEPVWTAPPSKRTKLANMTLDEDMLDCGVCYLPLKPPIFQCDVGHVLCSSCRDKLAATGKCHVCRKSIIGGYRRCHALEQLVESIRGSCPNAIYGCAARVPYYDLHAHLRACPQAPCHCPAEVCGFVGSTSALLDHFVSTHKWPCIRGVQNSEKSATHLRDGFNFMTVVHDTREYLFLLRVVRSPFGRAISSLCIHPQAAADDSPSKNDSAFEVSCTDLSSGMSNLSHWFRPRIRR